MRLLFTFAGGGGHFDPLGPVARAAEDAGHAVAFGCQPGMVPVVEAAGFTAFDTGGDTLGGPGRRPLLELNPEREDEALREGFARRTAGERAGRILALCAQWKPDLVVCDEVDFGAMVAAERFGVPHASVSVIAAGSFIRPELVAEPLNELRAQLGLPPDPGMRMLSRYLVLAPLPPSYRHPAFPLPATAHPIRPVMLDPAPAAVEPPWKAARRGAPTVYFTLGTIFNLESGDLFDRVIAGLTRLPVNLVVTVGRHIDPAEFGTQPEHVHIHRYLPQQLVLPHCQLVVSHGGSGSVIGALAHGVPMVLVPMGADQPHNAARCADLGLARVLDAVRLTPDTARDAASAVLADPAYRHAAERLRDEAAALPGPAHAVALLERLATRRTPLPGAVLRSPHGSRS
jgi:UDP:flavonoid glycosyltransferase YjiC (YdhE family)